MKRITLICLAISVIFAACSRERGDLPKRDLPEYVGIFSAGSGKRPAPLTASTQEVGPDLSEDAVFIVHLQGLSRMGNPEDQIRLLDRSLIRHEVEQIKKSRQGEVILTRLHPPREQFSSFNKLTVRFRPAPKPDMLIAVPDALLKPGLYTIFAGGEEYPFSVRLGSKALYENPHVGTVDHYFVTLDSEVGDALDELLALSQRGLAIAGNRNSIGQNAILEDFYRDANLLDEEMQAHRNAAITAWKSKSYDAALKSSVAAMEFFGDDKQLSNILQHAPEDAAKLAMKEKRWSDVNEWIERGRGIVPDKEPFEKFAIEAAYESAMAEAREHFESKRYESAAKASERAGLIAPEEKNRKVSTELNRNAWLQHYLKTARQARANGHVDDQFDAVMRALDYDSGSSEARQLGNEAREKITSDPNYYGKYFIVIHRFKFDLERLINISFTADGKRLHAFFDNDPQWFLAWDVDLGTEVERIEVKDVRDDDINSETLATLIEPIGMDRDQLREANRASTEYDRYLNRLESYKQNVDKGSERLKALRGEGGSLNAIGHAQTQLERDSKRLESLASVPPPVSAVEFRFRNILSKTSLGSIFLDRKFSNAKSFMAKNRHIVALESDDNYGRLLLVDPIPWC